MVQLELPHINVLTKMDLFENHAPAGEIDKCAPVHFLVCPVSTILIFPFDQVSGQ